MRNKLCAIALTICIASPAHAETITGRASVIDGDTLEIHGHRVRLSGIDAPESDQLCRGADSLQYRCGAKAANELAHFIAGRPVSCKGVDIDRYKRIVAICSAGGVDLGEWIVRAGLAFDWPRYSKGKYAGAQKEAARAERGVWAGSFVMPQDYRACRWGGGQPSGCSDEVNAR